MSSNFFDTYLPSSKQDETRSELKSFFFILFFIENFVDIEDCALLHVAAAIDPDVQSERIFAFAAPVNGDGILAVLRKLYPDRTFPADFQSERDLSDIVLRKRAEALLRGMGQSGWTSLEESVRRNTEDLV